jgi:hypothetical protein
MTWDEWIKKVDRHIGKVCGLGTRDLADQPYREWWEDDMPPSEAAHHALEDEGFPFE